MKHKTCPLRRCGRDCLAVETENGRVMLLDPGINERGNVVLLPVAFGDPVAHVLRKDEDDKGLPRYLVHYATCAARKTGRTAQRRTSVTGR